MATFSSSSFNLFFFLNSICCDHDTSIKRGGGADQEHSLWKDKVKHGPAWSPNGWVTVMCSALHPLEDFSGVKFSADSTNVLWIKL